MQTSDFYIFDGFVDTTNMKLHWNNDNTNELKPVPEQQKNEPYFVFDDEMKIENDRQETTKQKE